MAVLCAIIAVDEIILDLLQSKELAKDLHPHCDGLIFGSLIFWKEVKNELNKMNIKTNESDYSKAAVGLINMYPEKR